MSGFSEKPVATLTRDGRRLNLRHGPIDLIVDADGPPAEVKLAYRQAVSAFETVLTELVGELDLLRSPVGAVVPSGSIALQMHKAAAQHTDQFVTPMVAVAGAVADHVLRVLTEGRDLERVSVNNGGDIALYLADDQRFDIGVCANLETGEMTGNIRITAEDVIGGIATSGWRGRSHSLGIADTVTVLAKDAATADAAATMIANEVTLDQSPNVRRAPAKHLSPDSDLGDRLVAISVGRLTTDEIGKALDRGLFAANTMVESGLIAAAFLCLAGEARIAGDRCALTSVAVPRRDRIPEEAHA